jgi:hypothetical protein
MGKSITAKRSSCSSFSGVQADGDQAGNDGGGGGGGGADGCDDDDDDDDDSDGDAGGDGDGDGVLLASDAAAAATDAAAPPPPAWGHAGLNRISRSGKRGSGSAQPAGGSA